MGTSSSTPETPEPAAATTSPAAVAVVTGDDSFQWPENLYIETRDMAAASFLIYTFGYILDTARKVDGLEGLEINSASGEIASNNTRSRLGRSFTPQQVQQIVESNRTILGKHYPSEFIEESSLVLKSLELLQEREKESGKPGSLTLVEYDDHHQDEEMVYGVAKDDINKRISLCFRGTDNSLAAATNWSTNVNIFKQEVDAPESIKGDVDKISFHRGFYNYIFGKTASESDAPEKTKFDEIMQDVKPLIQANPDYKVYVTGHSLGAALSSIVAFYLATDPDVPKPVTCINFASPRVGDYNYLKAVNTLERNKQLRFLRIVNDNDSIAMLPMVGYHHAGFQIRLYNDPSKKPELTYPKLEESSWSWWGRAFGNNIVSSLNLSYDHGEYRERVDENESYLRSQDLNKLYNDVDLVGFTWA